MTCKCFVPEITGELGKVSFFGSKDRMAMTLKEIEVLAVKRHDQEMAQEEDGQEGGDEVAGPLLEVCWRPGRRASLPCQCSNTPSMGPRATSAGATANRATSPEFRTSIIPG